MSWSKKHFEFHFNPEHTKVQMFAKIEHKPYVSNNYKVRLQT